MRHRSGVVIAVIVVVSAVALCNNLSAQIPDNSPQINQEARDREVGRDGRFVGQGDRVLIARGLSLAIEGSTLQGLAFQRAREIVPVGMLGPGGPIGPIGPPWYAPPRPDQTEAVAPSIGIETGAPGGLGPPRTGGAGTGTRGTGAGDVGSGLATFGRNPWPSRTPGPGGAYGSAFPGPDQTGAAVSNTVIETGAPGGLGPPRTGGAGTGTRGSGAGDVGSGLATFGRNPWPVGTQDTGTTGAPTPNAEVPEPRVAGFVGTNRTMLVGGRGSAQLLQHARSAFEASDRLLRQATSGGVETDRFYKAANRYATTLKTLGGASMVRGGISNRGVATPGVAGDTMNGIDRSSVSLVNHGVKQALDSFQLKQMIRTIGTDTAAGRALMDHARQMDAESGQAIDSVAVSDAAMGGLPGGFTVGGVASTAPGAAPGMGGGGRGTEVQLLVQQAREVLHAIRELDGGFEERGTVRPGTRFYAPGTRYETAPPR